MPFMIILWRSFFIRSPYKKSFGIYLMKLQIKLYNYGHMILNKSLDITSEKPIPSWVSLFQNISILSLAYFLAKQTNLQPGSSTRSHTKTHTQSQFSSNFGRKIHMALQSGFFINEGFNRAKTKVGASVWHLRKFLTKFIA